MVSTRTKTDSLLAKKATFADEQAAACQQSVKRKPGAIKAKSTSVTTKPSTLGSPRDTQQAGLDEEPPKKANGNRPTAKTKAIPPISIPDSQPDPSPSALPSSILTSSVLSSSVPTSAPTKSGAPAQEEQGPFLALPPELRNRIYSYALVKRPMNVNINATRPYFREPGLLCVSRQIREEEITVFYGENSFVTEGSVLIAKFLRTVDEKALRQLRDVRLSCKPVRAKKDAITRLNMLLWEYERRGLRRNAMRFEMSTKDGPVWASLDEFESKSKKGR